jgi:AraC-like DNA-binding protein
MPGSTSATFSDPEAYQAAIRPAQVEVFVTAKGNFTAELNRTEFSRLWTQRGREKLPRVIHSTVRVERPPIFFLASADQPPMRHSGMEISFGDLVATGAGSSHDHRTWAACHWGTLSLAQEDLAAAGHALAGRDLAVPSVTRRFRPAPALMSRLLSLHATAERLAKTAPDILARPQVTRALEQALTQAMIACLTESAPVEMGSAGRLHTAVIARFEDFLAANLGHPLYVLDICAATGVSERTLRLCCHEHLGMGPVHYLWLRRMHMARHALVLADPLNANVTAIATDNGFYELGRFAVQYKLLFGEAPSFTLRRPWPDQTARQDGPFDLPLPWSASIPALVPDRRREGRPQPRPLAL